VHHFEVCPYLTGLHVVRIAGLPAGVAKTQCAENPPVVDLGAGLRYLLLPRLFVVGSLVDQLAFLPSQTFAPVCSGSVCTQLSYRGELQHNIGLLIDLELHP
jgi:hypothetical protein